MHPYAILVVVVGLALIVPFLVWLLLLRTKSTEEKDFPSVQSYFTHLTSEYTALRDTEILQEDKDEVEGIVARARTRLTWDDLFALELYLLKLVPVEKLRRKAWLVRERYRSIVSAERYAAYRASNPPDLKEDAVQAALVEIKQWLNDQGDLTPATRDSLEGLAEKRAAGLNAETLRADLEVILQSHFWHYRVRTIWEERRNWYAKAFLLIYTFLATLGIGAVVLMISLPPDWVNNFHPVFTLFVAAFMGSLGGFVSMLQRLQKIGSGNTHLSLIEMEYGQHSILYQSLITGAIFATVLLVIFAGGLLRGDLFPDYSTDNQAGVGFIDFLRNASGNSTQFAKLLVWSFIAGFAERLVPDFLDRVIARGKASEEKKEK